MNRNLLLAAAVAACAAAAPAFAAPAATNWGGFYAGINAGYGGDTFNYPVSGTYADLTPDSDVDPTSVDAVFHQTSSGFVGGGQVGYNYQFEGGWVVGLEADIDGSGIKGETSVGGGSAGGLIGGAGVNLTSKIDYLGTARVRVGYPIAEGRFLPYVTGGVAFAGLKTSAAVGISDEVGPLVSLAASHSSNRTGWTAGVGADYALSDNWSFRAEYLYVDLGKETLLDTQFHALDGVVTGKIGLETTANIVRVGLNYRFGR